MPIYLKAKEFSVAVIEILGGSKLRGDEILGGSKLRGDRDLWQQINDANDSVLSNMSEGFEQGSDAGFAKYLVCAKGSVAEVVTRLRSARDKNYITADQLATREGLGEALGAMLGGFIRYLRQSDFRNRGWHKIGNEE